MNEKPEYDVHTSWTHRMSIRGPMKILLMGNSQIVVHISIEATFYSSLLQIVCSKIETCFRAFSSKKVPRIIYFSKFLLFTQWAIVQAIGNYNLLSITQLIADRRDIHRNRSLLWCIGHVLHSRIQIFRHTKFVINVTDRCSLVLFWSHKSKAVNTHCQAM